MEELVLNIFAGISALFIISVLVALCLFMIVYDMKKKDKLNSYLKTLTEEERLVIARMRDNELTLKEFLKREGKAHEDK